MKYTPRKVFMLDHGSYVEYTYQAFCQRNEEIGKRYFIPIQGMLLEVPQKVYREFYREEERNRYLKRLERDHGLLSFSAFCGSGEKDFEPASAEDMEAMIIRKQEVIKLCEAVASLSEEERDMIQKIYYEELTEKNVGGIYGISQQAVSKRLKRILAKLKKIMES